MKFVLPGPPIAQQRARYRIQGSYAHVYDPQKKEKDFAQEILGYQLLYLSDCDEETYNNLINILEVSSLEVELTFFLPIPQSLNKKQKHNCEWGFQKHLTKPDIDNLQKFILDVGNGILWKDDKSITKIIAVKQYDKDPRTEITIKEDQSMLDEYGKKIVSHFSFDELRQFISDARTISNIIYSSYPIPEGLIYDDMEGISKNLDKFAKKYSTILAKIAKIKGSKDG